MDKWEYGSAYLHPARNEITATNGFVPNHGDGDFQKYLERAGEEGWELVAFVPLHGGLEVFFKRRKEPEAEQSPSPAES
jgi:hypothetical protein